ncbi:MAG: tRNA (guanosine(46)-N7)-methyltransferase TrmB, partial [Deltaproteobacteria bacterium]|nr:tRNA (guanosine(46)-N7)-methyltransferase TrmB [Deltaproteobacteria bacterium]
MQRVIPITSPLFVPETGLKACGAPERLFARQQPLAMEIGCGIGDFITALAAQTPQWNFLAVDIYNQGCIKTCRRLTEASLENVRVLRMEARALLTSYFEEASIAALYINCPDPWPKKRHHYRRLINMEFLRIARYFLVHGGEMFFCTDFDSYADEVEQLPQLPGLEFLGRTSAPPADYPHSKYMRRFREKGLPIHFFHYRKCDDGARYERPRLAP